jgi:hypothetical protein
MAYKVGSTIVIDNNGYVPYSRVSGAPAAGMPYTTYTKVGDVTSYTGSGVFLSGATLTGMTFNTSNQWYYNYTRTYYNCNCNCECRC